MSVPGVLPPSPPSTSSRRKSRLPRGSVNFSDPPDSPASFPGSSNSRTRKRVEFSPWTNTDEPPSSSSQPIFSLPRVKSIPPSAECQSSLKSILKTAGSENKMPQPVDDQQAVDHSIGEMMESIIQQLVQDDRSISVDAYRTLASVIREYDEVPEEVVLKSKINTILKYIKRDLLRQVKPDEPQIADTNVITQALKVLVIFVWKLDYASLLSDEYRSFIVDRSIQVIAEHSAPKSVIIHYLHLLATQDFRPGLITSNNRVGRLLEALKALTEHVKGNGAVSERLLVYQKLLDQARPVMKAKAALWVEELLTGMTSSLKDTRTKAMILGMKSCSAFPASSSISMAVRSVLGTELEPGKTVNSVMCRRLEKMITSKEEAPQVPQIWAIVLLLSNAADARIDNWSELKDWLKVIQRCFNCSESSIRQQANMAWNRFVYVVRPHEASDTLMGMLAKPLTAQLERQGTEKTVKGSRPTAVSSYCNLLYYAFRPAASHKQYTRVWNEYIVRVMKSSFFEKNSANCDLSCRVFIALLWNANKGTKVWNENRALENTPVEPEELPTIDCKWIRSRSAAIIDMFRVLLRYSSWGASGESNRAYIAVAWTHFLKALRDSSSKEIKPSLETKNAVAGVVEFLGQLWTDSHQETIDADHSVTIAQKRQMTRIVVHELDHMAILAAVETGCVSLRQPPVLLEIFESIVSGFQQLEQNGEMRSHLQTSRSTFQTLLCQYEKCLELLDSSVVRDFQSETSDLAVMTEDVDILHHVLQKAGEHQQVETLTLLSAALAMLLKDEARRFNGLDDSDCSHAYRKLSNTTIKLLAKVPPTAVQMLDSLFAACLGSSHSWLVNETVNMWTKQCGQYEQLTPGPSLSKALLTIEDLVDGRVPDLLPIADAPTAITEAPLAVSDRDTTPVSTRHASLNHDSQQAGDASPGLGSEAGGIAEAEATRDIASSPERPVSRPRSRHDDSQVHFVAIESSPPWRDEPESQYLTAHQKEVRHRQRSEPAVVFPDLRSSPRQHSKSQNQIDCEFARKAASQGERPSTPTLPTHDQAEPEILASPTPRARQFTKQITDIEVPSSPPSMLDHQGREVGKSEITSSPPQRSTDDVDIGIDLGIPQADELSNQVTMDGEQLAIQDMTSSACDSRSIAKIQPHSNYHAGGGQTEASADILPDTQEAEYAPSTVDETLMTNDESGSNNGSQNGTSGMGSDDIDMLSASQLSQDLDRHLSQTVEDALHQELDEEIRVQDTNNEVAPQPLKPVSRHTRKRKSSNMMAPSSKRRRSRTTRSSSTSTSQLSINSSQLSEMCDTIEVMPCQPVSPVAVRDFAEETLLVATEAEQPPKRRRGRPRKNTRKPQAQQKASTVASDVVDDGAIEDGRLQQDNIIEYADVETELPVPVPVPEAEAEAEAAVAMEEVHVSTENTTTDASAEMDGGEVGVQPDVVSSLQAILDRLQTTGSEKIDLRAVDDLCFQIRFQAQVIAQQQTRAE